MNDSGTAPGRDLDAIAHLDELAGDLLGVAAGAFEGDTSLLRDAGVVLGLEQHPTPAWRIHNCATAVPDEQGTRFAVRREQPGTQDT